MRGSLSFRPLFLALSLVLLTCLLVAAASQLSAAPQAAASQAAPDANAALKRLPHVQVIVPGEDRFTPFSQTVRAGEAVRWINMDTDDHTVVSLDSASTTGPHKINVVLPGTDSNGGKPGQFQLAFPQAGTFVYYCRFHSHLDNDHQPVAPGPKGGIQDDTGNHGTPMMGIIIVLPGD